MGTTYYKDGTGYRAVTDESPAGFKNVLFIGRGGPTLDTITEQAWTANQLRGLTQVPLADVPDDWISALGYDEPSTIEELPIFDLAGEELLDLAPIRVPARPANVADRQTAITDGIMGTIIVVVLWLLLSWIL